ncbi:MAG: OmpA family protein [bacterium]|nr:OmpA family protein [bacterium]
MVKRTLMFATMLTLAVAMGCTTTQKWMAGGAAVGATVGGIWGAAEGTLNAGEGAAVGAVTGATAGALVGDLIDKKNTDQMLADKDAQIKQLEAEKADLANRLAECERKLAAANDRIKSLEKELADLRERTKRTEITLLSDVLFKPGSARLSDAGKKALDDAAARLKSEYAGKFIMVEGHTDSDPIKLSANLWKDNWDLGAGRAMAVLRYLIDKDSVDPARCSAATFSHYQPVATNATKEGKTQNRRAIIVIYNQSPRAEKAVRAAAEGATRGGERPAQRPRSARRRQVQ